MVEGTSLRILHVEILSWGRRGGAGGPGFAPRPWGWTVGGGGAARSVFSVRLVRFIDVRLVRFTVEFDHLPETDKQDIKVANIVFVSYTHFVRLTAVGAQVYLWFLSRTKRTCRLVRHPLSLGNGYQRYEFQNGDRTVFESSEGRFPLTACKRATQFSFESLS